MGIEKIEKKKKSSSKHSETPMQKKKRSKSERAGILFPVSKIGRSLKKDGRVKRVGAASSVCLATVLEYVTAELLDLATRKCKKGGRKRVAPQDIVSAIRSDPELHRLLSGHVLAAGETVKKVASQLALTTSAAPVEVE